MFNSLQQNVHKKNTTTLYSINIALSNTRMNNANNGQYMVIKKMTDTRTKLIQFLVLTNNVERHIWKRFMFYKLDDWPNVNWWMGMVCAWRVYIKYFFKISIGNNFTKLTTNETLVPLTHDLVNSKSLGFMFTPGKVSEWNMNAVQLIYRNTLSGSFLLHI